MIVATQILNVGKYDVYFLMQMFCKWYYMGWKYGGGVFPHADGMPLRSCRNLSFIDIWASKAPHHMYFCFWKPIASQLRCMLWFEYHNMSFVFIKWMTSECLKRHWMLALVCKKTRKSKVLSMGWVLNMQEWLKRWELDRYLNMAPVDI